jgi:hypothetical protein
MRLTKHQKIYLISKLIKVAFNPSLHHFTERYNNLADKVNDILYTHLNKAVEFCKNNPDAIKLLTDTDYREYSIDKNSDLITVNYRNNFYIDNQLIDLQLYPPKDFKQVIQTASNRYSTYDSFYSKSIFPEELQNDIKKLKSDMENFIKNNRIEAEKTAEFMAACSSTLMMEKRIKSIHALVPDNWKEENQKRKEQERIRREELKKQREIEKAKKELNASTLELNDIDRKIAVAKMTESL